MGPWTHRNEHGQVKLWHCCQCFYVLIPVCVCLCVCVNMCVCLVCLYMSVGMRLCVCVSLFFSFSFIFLFALRVFTVITFVCWLVGLYSISMTLCASWNLPGLKKVCCR